MAIDHNSDCTVGKGTDRTCINVDCRLPSGRVDTIAINAATMISPLFDFGLLSSSTLALVIK